VRERPAEAYRRDAVCNNGFCGGHEPRTEAVAGKCTFRSGRLFDRAMTEATRVPMSPDRAFISKKVVN
jgi:hypothetical protein